jgi:protein-arginine kinase
METVKKGASTKQKNGNVQTVKETEKAKTATNLQKLDFSTTTQKEEIPDLAEKTKNLIATFRPSAEERIKNAEKFKILTEKYDHLKAKKEELEKFKISSDGTKERIYFENAEGYKLEVSNSNIIDDMLKLAEDTLNGILNNTEKQVQDFVI